MPIINGQYVYDQLPQSKDKTWTSQAFGDNNSLNGRDWSDTTSAAFNYLMKQQEQAYNFELWKAMNEYNSPAAQMSRYQDAGLNPNLIYGQQNTAQSPASASSFTFRSSGTQARRTQNALNMINEFGQIVKQAKDIYDYATYGAPERNLRNLALDQDLRIAARQETALQLQNYWNAWLQGREDLPADAPAVVRYQKQTDYQDAQIRRMEAYIKMIPDQRARTAALTALDDYRLKILQGQNDAILNINTGNSTADAFLRAFLYFGMSAI